MGRIRYMPVGASDKPREVMDIRQCANYLGLSEDTLYKYAADGLIPAFKFGNRWRFKMDIINHWMNRKSEENVKGRGDS